jgi:hypothetical protein
MWIRSQDEMTLKECDEFSLGTSNGKACIYGVKGNWESGESIPPILGEYETKERAIEILDEIQTAISGNGTSIDESSINGDIIHSDYVYEKPEK